MEVGLWISLSLKDVVQWFRALGGLLTQAVGSHPQTMTDVCLLSALTSLCPLPLHLPFAFTPFDSPFLFLFLFSFASTSQSPLPLPPSFPPPPVPVLLARGGLWVNSRFFISLLWLGGDERIAIPL